MEAGLRVHDKEDVVDARGAARGKERISIVAAALDHANDIESDSLLTTIER
jgi:hypothetical protein